MELSDSELLDFNARNILDYDDERAHAALKEHGDAFRYQLVAALHLDAWADRLEAGDSPATGVVDPATVVGWVNALRNIAAGIRECEYLPGGGAYEQVQRREP